MNYMKRPPKPKMMSASGDSGMPRFGSRAMRPGGMAEGGKVKKMMNGGAPAPAQQAPMPQRGMPQKQMPQRGMPSRGMPPRDMPPRGMPPRGMPQGGMPQGGMPQGGMPPRDMPQRGAPPPALQQTQQQMQQQMQQRMQQRMEQQAQQQGGPQDRMPQGGLAQARPTASGGSAPQANNPMIQRTAAPAMKKGGKVSMEKWEHSKADLAQDKKLAAKRGMSMEKWEKSAADKKHDAQQSMKGLKKGGDIMAIKDTPMGRKMASAAMSAKKMAKGGGIESKGKTKGRFV